MAAIKPLHWHWLVPFCFSVYVDHRSKWKPVNGWANAVNSVIHSTRAAFQAKVAARRVVSNHRNYTYTPPEPLPVLVPPQPTPHPTVTQAATPHCRPMPTASNSSTPRPPQPRSPLQPPSGPGPSCSVTLPVPASCTPMESMSSSTSYAALTSGTSTSSVSNLDREPQLRSYATLTPVQGSTGFMPAIDPSGSAGLGIISETYNVLAGTE